MDLKTLRDVPPWDWPEDTGETLLRMLQDERTSEGDLLEAVELAGNFNVVGDELAQALLAIAGDKDKPDDLRSAAAISLGPVLEYVDIEGFEDELTTPPISEEMFERIQSTFRRLFADSAVPEEVRRCVLEASVRAPQDWHQEAVRGALARGGEDWLRTAVFCMAHVRGFDAQILEALKSPIDDVHYEAVVAAGNWQLEGAWGHVAALAESSRTEKELRLAAIDAVASIRPLKAAELLEPLLDSDDEDIAEAAQDAMLIAEGQQGLDDEDEENEEWVGPTDKRMLN